MHNSLALRISELVGTLACFEMADLDFIWCNFGPLLVALNGYLTQLQGLEPGLLISIQMFSPKQQIASVWVSVLVNKS